jgi:hypothetical protein
MARIPRALEIAGPAQQTRSVVNVPVVEESTAGARVLQQAGRQLQEFGDRLYKADIDRKVTEADRKTREDIDREYRKIETDGTIDAETIETRFKESSDAVIAKNAEIVPQGGRNLWTAQARKWQSDGVLRSRNLTRERQLEGARAGMVAETVAIDKMAGDLSIQEPTFQSAVQAQRNFIDRQTQGGLIGKDIAAKLHADLDGAVRKDALSRKQSRVDGLVRSGQQAAAVRLIEEAGTFEERDSLYRILDAVENEQYQKKQRQRQEQEQAQKEVEADTSKTLDSLILEGGLTRDWLRANRDKLSEEDHQRGYAELGDVARGDVKSNPAIFAELTYRSAAGEDVSRDTFQAMSEGLLSKTDAGSLLARSGGNVEQPSWKKRGLDYIATALKVNELNPSEGSTFRLAEAINEWNDFVDSSRTAATPPTREEWKKEADAIVKSYLLIEDAKDMALNLPAPRSLGRRPQTQADLTEWQQKLAASDLSNDELSREVELLQRWTTALKPVDMGAKR